MNLMWRNDPPVKDGSWILALMNDRPFVVRWHEYDVAGQTYGNWITCDPENRTYLVRDQEPVSWMRIADPKGREYADWEGEIFNSEVGT